MVDRRILADGSRPRLDLGQSERECGGLTEIKVKAPWRR
jgi:hypothetical protein